MPSKECRKIRSFYRFFFLLTFLSATAGLPAQSRIEWEAVQGARYYSIEFTQNGELVLETRSEEPSLPLFLPAGDYEFKVKVINAFGKVASESQWSPLKVTTPATPFIIDFSPREIHDGGDNIFRSRVSGFIQNPEGSTTFNLENEEGKQINLEVLDAGGEAYGSDDNWEKVTLDPGRKSPAPGTWALIMTNPDGRENRMEAALTVLERLRPKIRKITPGKIEAGSNSNIISMEISGMEQGAVIDINGPAEIPMTLLKRDGEGNLEYSLNLEDTPEGWYSLVVTNPSGGFDVREKAIEILPVPPTPEEIAEASALEVDKKEPRAIPDYPGSIILGWHSAFPMKASDEYYSDSYSGFSLSYSRDFSNDLIRRIPGFKGLSWDVTYSYTNILTTFPLTDINLNRSDFLLGLSYITPFDFPVNLLLRASLGMSFSIYTSSEYDRDEWLGSFKLNEMDSLDFISRFGAGLHFDISSRLYMNLSCDFTATYYLSRTAWSIQPLVEGGWRW